MIRLKHRVSRGRRSENVKARTYNVNNAVIGPANQDNQADDENDGVGDALDDVFFGVPLAPAFAKIPVLRSRHEQHSSNAEIARCLLREFFQPPPDVIEGRSEETPEHDLPMEPLTEAEAQRAVFAAHPYKAPGPGDLPAAVWQELWPVLRSHITALFRLSLETATVPQSWKLAKIVPLRKPNKSDYTLAKAYRPIYLLATLGKNLEAVVAEGFRIWLRHTICCPRATLERGKGGQRSRH